MTLNEINIQTLLDKHTESFILSSDLATLKKHLLRTEPVIEVTLEASAEIERICRQEQQQAQIHLTQKMCDYQAQEDAVESQKDQDEARNDSVQENKISNFVLELKTLKSQYNLQNNQHQKTLNEINQIISGLPYLMHRDRSVMTYQPFRFRNSFYTDSIHSFPFDIDNHQSMVTYYPPISSLSGNYSFQLKGTLKEEQMNLRRLWTQMETLQQQIDDLKQQVTYELPQRKQARDAREFERMTRARARLYSDQTLQQLTPQNKELLQQQFQQNHHQLEQAQWELNAQVIRKSHTTLVYKLESLLNQPHPLNYTPQEQHELKRLMALMNLYLKKKDQLTQIDSQLALNKNALSQFTSEYIALEAKLRTMGLSNQELEQRNLNLASLQSELNVRQLKACTSRNHAAITGLVSVSIGALGAAYIQTLMTSSTVLLMIPGGLGLIGLGAFVFALGYHLHQRGLGQSIDANKKEYESNQSTFFSATQKSEAIRNYNLPVLKQKIEECQQLMTIQETQKASMETSIQQLLLSAQSTPMNYSPQLGLFNASNENYYETPKPTAPLEEELIHFFPFDKI